MVPARGKKWYNKNTGDFLHFPTKIPFPSFIPAKTPFQPFPCLIDIFSGSWSSSASIGLNSSFANSLLNASAMAVWVSLYFVIAMRILTLCFSSNFVTSLLNSDPLSHWNVFGNLNTPPFYKLLLIQIQRRSVFWFLSVWRLYILMHDQRLLRYTYTYFPQKGYGAYNANQTGVAH